MQNISKSYPGVKALDNVTLELYPGEVHCLVGENGAGKSTLIKILSGAINKDTGNIFIDEKEVEINSPFDARRFGIGVIYQDFKLVPELSIAENILLGNEPLLNNLLFIDKKKIKETASQTLLKLGEKIDVELQVKNLNVAKRQIVEIAKSLSGKIKIIAMDEPTASLSKSETENLFNVIRKLKEGGVGIIYISHRIEEIFRVADRITVLRDGKLITTCSSPDADRNRLIKWMVGRDLDDEYPHIRQNRRNEILRIENINSKILKDVSLSLYKGEILGLAGLNGAGRSELANIIFGATKKESGKVFFKNEEVNFKSPREAIDAGIALLTEDRNLLGLLMQMSVKENISISNLDSLLKGPFIQKKKEKEAIGDFIFKLKIKTPSAETKVENLSGGNRQKVVLARWLFSNAGLIIFDEPTVGIDIGVKYEIYNLINQLVDNGVGVIVISSDLPEIIGICHRIAVMSDGEITGELTSGEINQEKIMELAVVNL
jgi:ribose transport system ATP-binding protein